MVKQQARLCCPGSALWELWDPVLVSAVYNLSQLTHHPADELIVNGLLHKQTASSNAVLPFVEIH